MIDSKGMFRTYIVAVCSTATVVGMLVWLAGYIALTVLERRNGRPDDAYILVQGDRAVPLWNYQQLPMKDCAWCRRAVNLNRHHVIPQAANPALRDVRENLVVLCRDCHFVLGHRCDWKQYNPDVLYICTHFTNCIRSAETRYGLTNAQERVQAPQEPQEDQPTNTLTGPQEAALERILEDGKHDE